MVAVSLQDSPLPGVGAVKTALLCQTVAEMRQKKLAAHSEGTMWRRLLADVAKPVEVLRRRGLAGLAKAVLRRGLGLGEGKRYIQWIEAHSPTVDELARMASEAGLWAVHPVTSVVMATFNPDPSWLQDAIASVRNQVYENWELCIADDASSRPHVREMLERAAASDPRIRVTYRSERGGISAAGNAALQMATGEYVVFLDHDDVMYPQALFRVAEYLLRSPSTDIVYSDEDLILVGGKRGLPMFKPDWSPAWLLNQNYITHMVAARRTLVDRFGGLRSEYDGAQDHDLLLRMTERTQEVGHITDVLYSWRQVAGSAALAIDEKPAAWEAGRRAVEDACQRRGLSSTVTLGPQPGTFDVCFAVVGSPRVAIIIPTCDRRQQLAKCVSAIVRQTTYSNYEIVIVNNDGQTEQTLDHLRSSHVVVVDAPAHSGQASAVNMGVENRPADYVVLLSNDTVLMTTDWLERLLGLCQQADVGAVGCRLSLPNGRVENGGIGLGYGHLAFNLHNDWAVDRDVSAVSSACMMVSKETFVSVGGLDDQLPMALGAVDFCLRLRKQRMRILYTPHVTVEVPKSSSHTRLGTAADSVLFRERWGDEAHLRDPYLNPNVVWPESRRWRRGRLPQMDADPPWLKQRRDSSPQTVPTAQV